MKDKYSYDDMMNLAGWMAASDNKRPIAELKEEAEEYIKKLDAEHKPDVAVPVEDKEKTEQLINKIMDYVGDYTIRRWLLKELREYKSQSLPVEQLRDNELYNALDKIVTECESDNGVMKSLENIGNIAVTVMENYKNQFQGQPVGKTDDKEICCSSCGVNEIITNGYCNCCGAAQSKFSEVKL